MAALRLDAGMAHDRSGKARPHADNDRSHVLRRAEVPLCKDGIDEHIRMESRNRGAFWIHEHGNRACMCQCKRLFRRGGKLSFHILHLRLAEAYRLAEGDRTSHGSRHGDIEHADGTSCPMKAHRDARCQISCPAYHDEHVFLL